MKAIITDIDALRATPIADIAAYLRATGWSSTEPIGQRYTLWSNTLQNEHLEIEVPARTDFVDYGQRIAEVLTLLSSLEQRSQLDIIVDIRRAQVDVLRVHLEGPELAAGRLELDGGSHVAARVRDALLAAACAVVDPKPAFASRKPDAAMEFVRTARLAPPELGSHVVVVEVPLPPQLQLSLMPGTGEDSFARRVNLLFSRALQHTRAAVSQAIATQEATSFVDGVSEGLSSNLCDAVADIMIDARASTVTFAHTWATSRPVPPTHVNRARFHKDDAPILREAARVLRERSPREDFELEGQIIGLSVRPGTRPPDDGGTATVAATVDGRVRRVKISLGPEDYPKAIKAHETGQTFSCEGELIQERGAFTLRNPRRVASRAEE